MTFETFPNKAMGDLEQQDKKCCDCWFYHKGKHKDLDDDGILRNFDGVCSCIDNISIGIIPRVKSVFENGCCDSFQGESVVTKRLIRIINDENQKTFDNLGGIVEKP